MGTINYASGNDEVPFQVGQVLPPDDDEIKGTTGRGKAPANLPTDEDAQANRPRTTNIVSGNARVGFQADTVISDFYIRM